MTKIETPRLLLEPLAETHAELLFDALCDPEVHRFVPQEPPADVSALRDQFRRRQARTSPDGQEQWLNWAVIARESGEGIGRVEAAIRPDASALIAYLFGPRWWSKGLGSESIGALMSHLRQAFGVRRFVAHVDTRNERSSRMLERLGFRRVATLPAADHFKGAVSDEVVYERAIGD